MLFSACCKGLDSLVIKSLDQLPKSKPGRWQSQIGRKK